VAFVYLTAEDMLEIHTQVVNATGGSHGVRDKHAILTLEDLPRQLAFGQELYPTVELKAALYIRNIITAHPFIDGNKRTAMTAAGIFLGLNGYALNVPLGGIEKFAPLVIKKKLDLEAIADWIKQYSKKKK
jgi:death-on-curing protein